MIIFLIDAIIHRNKNSENMYERIIIEIMNLSVSSVCHLNQSMDEWFLQMHFGSTHACDF